MWGLKQGKDYKYNAIEGTITFTQTGSQIYLKDLAYYPSDPEFDSLGSTEYTGAFIDEASQIREKAKNVVMSRLRYRIDEYGIIPKLLMTCNPHKGFLYMEFYKPWKQGILPRGKAFIAALPGDNPYLPEAYIQSLRLLDRASQERLLKGNWEYDDDPGALMDYESITDLFSNSLPEMEVKKDPYGRPLPDTRPRYIVCDVARFGEDRTVICIWYGWELKHIYIHKKTKTTTVAALIKGHAQKHNVPASHIMVDEDGVGGGVKDQLYGVKGFIANSRPARKENYMNFKAQCAYALGKKVVDRGIRIHADTGELRQTITEELEQIKAVNLDSDGKLQIMSKDDVKANIGRSPDIGDTLIMRMAFEFVSRPKLTFVNI